MFYAALIVAGSELIHWVSVQFDPTVPIHLEVPARLRGGCHQAAPWAESACR
jgi:hypothetical protein